MARQLWSAGHRVDPLVLIDPPPPGEGEGQSEGEEAARLAADFAFDLAAMHAGGAGPAPASDTGQALPPPVLRQLAAAVRLDPALPLPRLLAGVRRAGILPPELDDEAAARLFELFLT